MWKNYLGSTMFDVVGKIEQIPVNSQYEKF